MAKDRANAILDRVTKPLVKLHELELIAYGQEYADAMAQERMAVEIKE